MRTLNAMLALVLSGGVMVAQESLELFVMVRIHAGQPLQFNFRLLKSVCLLSHQYSVEQRRVGWCIADNRERVARSVGADYGDPALQVG